MGKRRAVSILSDTNTSERSFSDPSSFSDKRIYSTASLSELRTEDGLMRKSYTVSISNPSEKDASFKSSVPLRRLSSSKSSGSLLFNTGRRLSIKRKATSPEKPEEKSEILAVDNNLKTGAVFYFDNDIALSTVNLMLMAIRRSQIGYYSMPFPSEGVSRANTTPSMLSQFIEGLLDVYHTYITTPYNVLKEEQYFYLKGYNFVVMFTHNKSGKCICLGSFPSDLLTHLKQEDIRYVRMRDEDEDELA
ncbi:hypothetical protein WA588_003397, partial [Blastocystis sp. NMH]